MKNKTLIIIAILTCIFLLFLLGQSEYDSNKMVRDIKKCNEQHDVGKIEEGLMDHKVTCENVTWWN